MFLVSLSDMFNQYYSVVTSCSSSPSPLRIGEERLSRGSFSVLASAATLPSFLVDDPFPPVYLYLFGVPPYEIGLLPS